MGKPEKIGIINSFIYANFKCCPVTRHFSSCDSLRKIEKNHKRCLRIILDDYESDYEILLDKSWKEIMAIKRLRVLATNDINPSYMKNIFTLKVNLRIRANGILVEHQKTASYGD